MLVIDDDGSKLGILTPAEALARAQQKELDLVEISPTANPPVCRIMDYGKFRYQQSKKTHEAKRRQHQAAVKEIKFRPAVDEHDYDFKKNHICRFLQHGDKVKVVIMFRGRERAHKGIGELVLRRVIEDVAEFGSVESTARAEGPHLQVVLGPKANKGGKPKRKEGGGPSSAAAVRAARPRPTAPPAATAMREPQQAENTGDDSAKAQDAPRSSEAVQGHGQGEGHEGPSVQVPHPDQEDTKA